MTASPKLSAGVLLYRCTHGQLELFLAHPGGPFWRHREEGAWSIPKGIVEAQEDPFTAAQREFREETGIEVTGPWIELGSIRQKGGKEVRAWACEGEIDPEQVRSNSARIEWPPRSKRWIEFPEIDRCGWFPPAEARRLINPAQITFIDRLQRALDLPA